MTTINIPDPNGGFDFSDLRAVYINCTLKPSPALSHTRVLANRSIEIMRKHGVAVEVIRAVGHDGARRRS